MPVALLVPAALAGLAALVGPVLLHLRRRERERPMRFPSLMFLQRVTVTTARRRRITDWPVLLLRAAIVGLAVLAFTRPVWRPRPRAIAGAGNQRVVIALDRSMSMGHLAVWSAARDSAKRVIRALSPGDRVAVVAFDEAATVEQPLTTDHAAALAAIDRIRPGSRATRFGAAIRSAGEVLARDAGIAGGEIVVVTDLQRSGAAGVAGVTLAPGVTLQPLGVSPQLHGNSAIVHVDVHRVTTDSGRPRLAVSVLIASHGLPAERHAHVDLSLNGRRAATLNVILPPDGSSTAEFPGVVLPVGAIRLVASLDPDSLVADDSFTVALPADLIRRVILVTPPDLAADELFYVERALETGNDPALRVEQRSAGTLNAATLRDALAVIVYDTPLPSNAVTTALAAYVHDGGGVIAVAGSRLASHRTSADWLPGTIAGLSDRTADGGGTVGSLALDHPIFAPFRGAAAASLGSARLFRYARMTPAADTRTLARFDDGQAALIERRIGGGRVVLDAVPLDATSGDFPLQPTYLPFVRGMVLYAGGASRAPLWFIAGDPWAVPVTVRNPVIRTPSGQLLRPEPTHGIRTVTLDEAGFYAVYDGGPGGDPITTLAVNHAARESDLTPMRPADLLIGVRPDSVSTATSATMTLTEAERRQQIWRMLLVLAALALLVETWMTSRGWRGTAVSSVGTTAEGQTT